MIKEIKIGIALLMLFSMMGAAYAADSSNDVINYDIPVPPGFHRLSDVSYFNNGKEILNVSTGNLLPDSYLNDIKVQPGFQNLSDVNFFNNSKEISKSAADQILVPDGFINSVKNLGPNITQFPQNITANLVPILSSGKAQYLSNQLQPITIQSLGDITFTGNVSILWKQSIDGNQIVNSGLVPDLDGDGLKDMLAIIYDKDPYTNENEYTLIANKGSNGAQLWSQSITGKYISIDVYGIVDLNGDGLNDVLIRTGKYDATTGTYTYSFKAKKGSTGVTLWSQSISGTSVYLYGYSAGDLDGDGLNDVLVNTQKYDATTGTYTTKLIAKKGSNGVNLWIQSISGRSAYLYGSLVVDLDGDGLNDVLVNTNNYDTSTGIYTTTLIAKKGSNGANLWIHSLLSALYSPWINGYIAGDLNGDGLNDVLVNTGTYNPSTSTYTYTLVAKKGSTGDNLWSQSISGRNTYLNGYPAGDLDGDGLNDVLVYTQKYDATTGIYTYSLIAEKGSTGETLWSQSISGSSAYLYGYTLVDLNGDGLRDVLVITQKYDTTTGIYTYSLIAKKGSNGVNLWIHSISGRYAGLYVSQAGDLDGDGLMDVLVNTRTYDTTTGIYTKSLIAKKGSNGVNLWTQSISGASSSNPSISGNSVSDLNGDGLRDVLVNTGTYDTTTGINTNSLIAKKGSTGETLWSHSISGRYAGLYVSQAGDLNGDGLNDVFVNVYKYDATTNTYTYSLILKKGSTGDNLWSQSITGSSVYLSGYTVDDLNGDGLRDVLVYAQEYNMTTHIYTYTSIAKKGSNGLNLWSQSISGKNVWLNVIPVGDLNGDGLKDVLVNTGTSNTTTGAIKNTFIAKKGKDGTQLWKASANTWIWINYYTEDLNGDGMDDVLFRTFRKIYTVKTKI